MSEQLIQAPCTFGENGNFLLERELGTGGMGGVYMGRDKMLDRPVAVKVMLREFGEDPEFVEKFRREAQSVAKLIHPNIAQIYSYGICDGLPYIAMELASGGSLYSLMNANPGKVDVTRVIKICQQVAQALQCASDQGFVHGDVKPENILLDSNGNAKLVDFGLAAMQKDTDEIWGTPYYISPEKVKKEPIDFRADMYSLGGTLYHALTGVAPFEGDDSIAVVKKRFDGMPKRPSELRADLTPAIDDLVMKMLAFDKEERYPSFEALLDAFKNVLTSGLTAQMERPKTGLEKKRKGKGTRWLKVLGAAIGVILLIGGAVGGFLWYQDAAKKARAAKEQARITAEIGSARGAIAETLSNANKFADEFADAAARAVDACQKPTDELKKIVSEDEAKLALKGLWDRASGCKANADQVRQDVQKIVAKGAEAEEIKEATAENKDRIAAISKTVADMFDQVKASNGVEKVKTEISFIKTNGKRTVKQTIKRLKREKLEAERKAKEEAAAAAAKAQLEKQSEEKKSKMEAETAAARAKFDAIVAQGCIRQLDWKNALRQLKSARSEMTTPEGQLACDLEIRKVNDMKKAQDVLIKNMNGFTFKKQKLKGAKVIAIDEREIRLEQGKTTIQLTWQKFYSGYFSNLVEVFNRYIFNGRKNSGLSQRAAAEAMAGAALTLRIVCAGKGSSAALSEKMARKAVAQFPEFLKTAQRIFPDINFQTAE